ncbi:glycosyltransferase family 2 protein [Deefgea rivuli]|uniref:glycosyltransferase family 2 protein n=1 Tax=Deefgea rivuli TaxID=400948 RepID=UPI000B2DCF24|nr:glycosyltransferase family 2 protein [Deefgea rivuli]
MKNNNNILSAVIPVFNEGLMIKQSVQRVDRVLTDSGIPHEIILIDDGSTDHSWAEIQSCVNTMAGVKAIKLSRNFGKESALCAGLNLVKGDCCVCLDSDMQHPPEIIPQMYQLWLNEGYEVVEGVKSNRGKESLSYKLSAGLFYKVLQTTSGIDLNNASDFRLLDRNALMAWQAMPEKQTFFRGMSSWIGFQRTQVEFEVAEREMGTSKWSFTNLVKLAVQGVTSYTAAPLYASAFMGAALLLAFFVLLCQTFIMKALGYAADGFTTVIALQLVIGGALMLSVGIIGIYIEKIYEEVKGRPRYIVQQQLENPVFYANTSSAQVSNKE